MNKTNNESKRNVLGLSVQPQKQQNDDEPKTEKKSTPISSEKAFESSSESKILRDISSPSNDPVNKQSEQYEFKQKNKASEVSNKKQHKETLSKEADKQRLQNNSNKKRHKSSNSTNTKSSELCPPLLLSSSVPWESSKQRSAPASELHYSNATSSVASTSTTTTNLLQQPATQFSVQRSDSDGLRMRISAIRPPNPQPVSSNISAPATSESAASPAAALKAPEHSNRNRCNSNNSASSSSQREKLIDNSSSSNTKSKEHKKRHQQQQLEEKQPHQATSSKGNKSRSRNSVEMETGITSPQYSSVVRAHATSSNAMCLSDATESGCSEATTMTVATVGVSERTTKRCKMKRKKAQLKTSDVKRSSKKSHHHYREERQHHHHHHNQQAFTSDTDDEGDRSCDGDCDNKKASSKMIQQRAPRLLLKAINSKNTLTQPRPLTHNVTSTSVGILPSSDNIGISSSDNELPDLVNAAIKRVESDTDDDDDYAGGASTALRKGKSKSLQQYQSTLLQDFVEKTQMLSQPTSASASVMTGTSASTSTTVAAAAGPTAMSRLNDMPSFVTISAASKASRGSAEFQRINSKSQTETIDSGSGGVGGAVAVGSGDGNVSKLTTKRRGRPKKGAITLPEDNTTICSNAPAPAGVIGTINESGDSGVISTSTTLSMSPSPNVTKSLDAATQLLCSPSASSQHHRHKRKSSDASSNAQLSAGTYSKNTFHESSSSSAKPKIDIAYLDKRMYAATERVLYPPPRNKRRQSMSAQKHSATSVGHADSPGSKGPMAKEELQLDPAWRKIDVNKKFRRPSVSGYKSDGGGGNLTICSKVLAAKSGYVSDYGHTFHPRQHHHHSSGYKSDASCKSRYSVKSCASRRARAKSCGYRSDFKESCSASVKSSKFRRKRRSSILMRSSHSKSVGNLNDEQDILQLAGLSLGQSGSEESNEYVCKPSLDSLPTTSVSKKYGEINRFITTGEYFGRGSGSNPVVAGASTALKGLQNPGKVVGKKFQSLTASAKRFFDDTLAREEATSQDGRCESLGIGSSSSCLAGNKQAHRKNLLAAGDEILSHMTARKIKSRRSSAASYCSSYYSGTSKIRRRRRRSKTVSSARMTAIDSKLLTEIDILTNSFNSLCRIHNSSVPNGGASGSSGSSNAATVANSTAPSEKSNKDRTHVSDSVSNKLHGFSLALMSGHLGNPSSVSSSAVSTSSGCVGSKRESRDRRNSKKRKISDNLDFALISAAGSNAAAALILTSSGSSGAGGSVGGTSKRRHKKTSGSSPDDHKLPLKKRHYIKTPGEKLTGELAAKIFANSTEAWAAAAATAKTTATTKSQQHYAAGNNLAAAASSLLGSSLSANAISHALSASSTKGSKAGLTPKKRHLMQNDADDAHPHHNHHHHGHHHSNASSATLVSSTLAAATSSAHMKGSSSANHHNISPLRIFVGNNASPSIYGSLSEAHGNSLSGGKLLDISPLSIKSATSANQSSDVVHKKRSRLEGLVSKIAGGHNDEKPKEVAISNASSTTPTTNMGHSSTATKTNAQPTTHKGDIASTLQLEAETSCPPPPGVFEPSVELEIQIPPPMAKLTESVGGIITKSEVDSPLLLEMNKSGFANLPTTALSTTTKTENSRGVVESLLDKTGGNSLLLKRKRKKFNRTGFPTVRRRKRKINDQLLLDITPDLSDVKQQQKLLETNKCEKIFTPPQTPTVLATTKTEKANEDEQTKSTNRTPRLSVVSLERLKGSDSLETLSTGTFAPVKPARSSKKTKNSNCKGSNKIHAGDSISETNKATSAASKERKLNKVEAKDEKLSSNKQGRTHSKSKAPATATETNPVAHADTKCEATENPKANLKKKDITEENKTLLHDIRSGRKGRAAQPMSRDDKKANKKEQILSSKPSKQKETKPSECSSRLGNKSSKHLIKKSSSLDISSTVLQKTSQALAKSTKPSGKSESTAFTKSSVQKIITAKSLEGKVKLPAGLDPNTNFSCKIRLKRRNSLYPAAGNAANSAHGSATVTGSNGQARNSGSSAMMKLKIEDTCEYSKEEIEASAAAKDINIHYLEHDVLPPEEGPSLLNWESEDFFLLDDDKASNSTSLSQRKQPLASKQPVKKNYLPAGLFSDYYKRDHPVALTKQQRSKKKTAETDEGEQANSSTRSEATTPTKSSTAPGNASEESSISLPMLPPPPYCEAYYRQTQQDFKLPYDIWWAYTHSKLPTLITVPSWNYRKIRTNIYSESVRPNLAGIDHPVCICRPDVGCAENCLNRMVYTECSPSNCPTREKCQNQKIQRHEVAPGVERFMTKDKGWGVRTKLPIAKGTYILEYVGEVVTEREFKDRMGTIYLTDIHHYCLHLDGGLVIDGHRMGSDGRFVNHSCLPNCEMQKWSVNGLSRMALFAKRNIEPGEEITYDYNFALFNPSEGQPCRCNTPQCRGVIGGKSQRVKPLPNEPKSNDNNNNKEQSGRSGRQRKRKARKNAQRMQTAKVIASFARSVQQLSEKERKLAKQYSVFLVRNYEKIRRCRTKKYAKLFGTTTPPATPTALLQSTGSSGFSAATGGSSAPQLGIANRRLSTSPSLAAQISALCSPRNIKTRGFTMAAQDPELERMAKMAIVLRDICTALDDLIKGSIIDEKQAMLAASSSSATECLDAAEAPNAAKRDAAETKTNSDDTKLNKDNANNNNTNKDNLNLLSAATTTPAPLSKKKKGNAKNIRTSASTDNSSSTASPSASAAQTSAVMISNCVNFKGILTHIEQGHYKSPKEFDDDMEKLFAKAQQTLETGRCKREAFGDENCNTAKLLGSLKATYKKRKADAYAQLLDIIGDANALEHFKEQLKAPTSTAVQSGSDVKEASVKPSETSKDSALGVVPASASASTSTPAPDNQSEDRNAATEDADNVVFEDVIRCICGLSKDEGLMIQCAKCMVWQHTECTKADVHAENYMCEKCEPREVDREIPLDEYTDDGHRYYLALLRGDLHIRQGDAVYVLRDIPVKDEAGNIVPLKKHTYETIGNIDYNECDIFRVERLWKNNEGKRFIFGHHFLRPHETFHEPTRRFYPNEVVRVPLYEVVPIELVIGRCWVLDRTTFCKGRPIECTDDNHCYICELRVDKSARFFAKAKTNHPICTKHYAFRKFPQRLKISKSYAPHDVDPALMKPKKQKTDQDLQSDVTATSALEYCDRNTSGNSALCCPMSSTNAHHAIKQEDLSKAPLQQQQSRKRKNNSPTVTNACKIHYISPIPPTLQTLKERRARLENVLKTLKQGAKSALSAPTNEKPLDLSYLLSGRGARQRKTPYLT